MDSSGFPDWKRIGRRLGKKLKDVLDPRLDMPGPSAEERQAQRIRDYFKGFVYFDTFAQLDAWEIDNVDLIQQANYPLLIRAAEKVYDCTGPRARLLLCHDYCGGYRDYEGVRPPLLESKLYSCEHLQFVDTFVYFSHKLICVPPASWTNTLHRNGVKVLGTCLIEPQTPDMDQLLAKANGKFLLTQRLADITNAYGFDGWLFNIEQDAPRMSAGWSHELLHFLSELRICMGSQKQLIWYDALTTDGHVNYQNGLTSLNQQYAEVVDGLFTNYKWTKRNIHDSGRLASDIGMPKESIFFGIDVWAQNNNIPGPRRITYPPKDGGGTNTGLAIGTLSRSGFSAAMFAPAWPFEHFSTTLSRDQTIKGASIAERVDQSLWTGSLLPEELSCDCHGDQAHRTEFYTSNAITRYANEYPVGSATFFETGFRKAFTSCGISKPDVRPSIITEGHLLRSPTKGASQDSCQTAFSPCLGSQDPLPSLLPITLQQWEEANQGPISRVLFGELVSETRPALTILTKLVGCHEEADDLAASQCSAGDSPQPATTRLGLYKLSMHADGSLQANIAYQTMCCLDAMSYGIYLAYFDITTGLLTYVDHELVHDQSARETVACLSVKHDRGLLVELGVFTQGNLGRSSPVALMNIRGIVVEPKCSVLPRLRLVNVHLSTHSRHAERQKRIVWSWEQDAQQQTPPWPEGIPYSRTTGPFSSFAVRLAGQVIGEAHSLEFPVNNDDVQHLANNVQVDVVGVLFGGDHVHSIPVVVQKRDLMLGLEDDSSMLE